jgi:nucleoside-diphosphate-sugar epimerase
MQLLVTGATGKVGVNLIERLLSDPRWRVARVRALCHSRSIAETDRIEVVKGSIEDRDCVLMVFALGDAAIGAMRCPRSQDGRRTRRSRFRHRDELTRVGGQEIYGQDALARRFACERCREPRVRQLGA